VDKPIFFLELHHFYEQSQQERQALIGRCNAMLREAKLAIFALHREKPEEADSHLDTAQTFLKKVQESLRSHPELLFEGSYRAALEEYTEAQIFKHVLKKHKWIKLEKHLMDPPIYFGALSDATGELVRYAVRGASQGNRDHAELAYKLVEQVVEFFLQMDLTGSLRQKSDQAKKNLQTLEHIRYEMNLRSSL